MGLPIWSATGSIGSAIELDGRVANQIDRLIIIVVVEVCEFVSMYSRRSNHSQVVELRWLVWN